LHEKNLGLLFIAISNRYRFFASLHLMYYHHLMRTTIDIDQDVLIAAKELAQRDGSTAGRVISRLARAALTGTNDRLTALKVAEPAVVYGFRPFPKNDSIVTNESINKLKDQEGI
jgi:hypothetical protein